MKARDPAQHLYRVQDHAATPARQEQVKRILNGTPVTELEPQQGSLF